MKLPMSYFFCCPLKYPYICRLESNKNTIITLLVMAFRKFGSDPNFIFESKALSVVVIRFECITLIVVSIT